MTFNTKKKNTAPKDSILYVLNLVINGWPSILIDYIQNSKSENLSFKPCYKWMTFNTAYEKGEDLDTCDPSFKPCYKWMTFNTITLIFKDFVS